MSMDWNGSIFETVRQLAIKRKSRDEAGKGADEMMALVHETTQWKAYEVLRNAYTTARNEVSVIEEELRRILVAAYNDTKARRYSGASVIKTVSVEYDRNLLLDWAYKEARFLIHVDEKELRKMAQHSTIPGVRLVESASVRIDGDLSPFLPEEEKEDGQGN